MEQQLILVDCYQHKEVIMIYHQRIYCENCEQYHRWTEVDSVTIDKVCPVDAEYIVRDFVVEDEEQ